MVNGLFLPEGEMGHWGEDGRETFYCVAFYTFRSIHTCSKTNYYPKKQMSFIIGSLQFLEMQLLSWPLEFCKLSC